MAEKALDVSYLYSALLVFQVDGLVFVAVDGLADLGRRLAELGLLVSEQPFFGAGGALSAVQSLETTAQTRMTQGTVASAIAGELIRHVADFRHILIDVNLPRVPEVLASELVVGKDRRQGTDFERRGGMVRRNIVSGIRVLGITGDGEGKDTQCESPTALEKLLHRMSLWVNSNWNPGFAEFLTRRGLVQIRGSGLGLQRTKKDGTNVLRFVPGGQ